MGKKEWIYVIGSAGTACLLSVLLIWGMTRWIQTEEMDNHKSSKEITLEDSQTYPYRVAAYRGHIGVFDAQGNLQSEVMVPVEQLPETDQQLLENGIKVRSREELYTLMEDYTG